MYLHPALIVDVGVFLLRRREELSVVQKPDVAHRLSQLHLGDEVIAALRAGGAREIVQFPIWSYHGSPAIRLIISARKAVQGVSAVLSGIVLHQANGALSEAANKVMSGEALQIGHPTIPQPK